MIQLHKWFPFVHPSPHDIKTLAVERRAERLEFEYKEAVKAEKANKVVDAYELELYNKRARERTIELEMFRDRKRFDKFA
jgi:hypothetical protein